MQTNAVRLKKFRCSFTLALHAMCG